MQRWKTPLPRGTTTTEDTGKNDGPGIPDSNTEESHRKPIETASCHEETNPKPRQKRTDSAKEVDGPGSNKTRKAKRTPIAR